MTAGSMGSDGDDESTRIAELLADIADFGRSAARIVARGREVCLSPDDDTQRRAWKSILIDLSSAAERLPESFRSSHPEVAWTQIRGMRNVIAHSYRDTDLDIVWATLRDELPRSLHLLDI